MLRWGFSVVHARVSGMVCPEDTTVSMWERVARAFADA